MTKTKATPVKSFQTKGIAPDSHEEIVSIPIAAKTGPSNVAPPPSAVQISSSVPS